MEPGYDDIELVQHSSEPSSSRTDSPELIDTEKKLAIEDACVDSDIGRLKALAESEGGLLTDELRRKAWPILLGPPVNGGSTPNAEPFTPWQKLPRHGDEDQVRLDVNRAFIYYPNNMTDQDLAGRKSELSDLIVEVLRRYPFLCYFQGYHDICQVFVLVLEPSARAPLVARLSLLRIRDFMLPTLAPTMAQLRLIPDILRAADPVLCAYLEDTEPFYALSGALTMYAHNIEEYGDIARLFDVLLAREPVFSIYMFAQIVISRRGELFDMATDDPSMLHLILSKFPKTLDLESLISRTIDLFEKHPPTTLRSWRRISSASSLKTGKSLESCAAQSLEDGERHFESQLGELRRVEIWDKLVQKAWLYRRPASAITAAVLVGIAAVYLRKHPGPVNHITCGFWRLFGKAFS